MSQETDNPVSSIRLVGFHRLIFQHPHRHPHRQVTTHHDGKDKDQGSALRSKGQLALVGNHALVLALALASPSRVFCSPLISFRPPRRFLPLLAPLDQRYPPLAALVCRQARAPLPDAAHRRPAPHHGVARRRFGRVHGLVGPAPSDLVGWLKKT
jgi:hypothetical protein